MSEPGRGHSTSPPSVAETAATGVLEQELVLEDIADRAIAAGFAAAHVIADTQAPLARTGRAAAAPFMGGRGFARYWRNLCAELDGHHYILLFAADPRPTTARPKRLQAVISTGWSGDRIRMRRGQAGRLAVELYNAGDTRGSIARMSRDGRGSEHICIEPARRGRLSISTGSGHPCLTTSAPDGG